MKTTRRCMLCMGLSLASGLIGFGHAAAAAPSEANPVITIHVHNYAGVAPETLAEAEEVATGIFREAGIETRWVDTILTAENHQKNSADHPSTSLADIQLSILPREMSDRLGMPTNVMGVVPGTDARIAYVFDGNVETLIQTMLTAYKIGRIDRRVSWSQILGHAIAHELGHLLLNLQGHSANGIMRGEWGLTECGTPQIECCFSRRSRRKSCEQVYADVTLIERHSMSPRWNPRHWRAKANRNVSPCFCSLYGFASADDAAVRPNRSAHPLPLLDIVRVYFYELARSAVGFPAPVPEFGDSFRDELRCRLALVRADFIVLSS